MVGIAQLVERLIVVQEVAGSMPVTHPKEMKARSSSAPGFCSFCSSTSSPPEEKKPLGDRVFPLYS